MPTFYMTIGVSGCGKTTWAMNQPNTQPRLVLDSDAIREELYGNWADQSHNAQVFDEMYRRTVEAMKRGIDDIYYVATNLSMKRRIQLLERLRKMFPQYIYECRVFIRTLETLFAQNDGREHRVPSYVITRQMTQFQLPVEIEGWDNISYDIEKVSLDYYYDIQRRVEAFGSQDNPHHTLTLSEHLEACFDLMTSIAPISINMFDLLQAADWHDVGKIFTKTYDEEGIAHYFGHENVGAQIALLCGVKPYAAQLINYHMVPYEYKALTTWKKRFDEDMWEDLLLLHQVDEGAH